MSREKWFSGFATIEPDVFEDAPLAHDEARALVDDQIARDLKDIVGPRGGHYEPIGPVERVESTDYDGTLRIDYRVRARYVRPPRTKECKAR